MKRLIFFYLLISIIILLASTGCSNIINKSKIDDTEIKKESEIIEKEEENNTDKKDLSDNKITLYYRDKDGILIPITRKISNNVNSKDVLNSLKDTPIIREDICRVGLYPTLPKDITINGVNIVEDIAYVDVDENILDYKEKSEEITIVNSIVYTIADYKNVEKVQLLINGEKYDTLRFGYPIDKPIGRKGINLLSLDPYDYLEKDLYEIYFIKKVNDSINCFVPVSIEIDSKEVENIINKIVNYNYNRYNLKSFIPEKISYNKCFIKEDILTIDINSENLTLLNVLLDKNAFIQFAFSLKQLDSFDRIQLTVDGDNPVIDGKQTECIYEIPKVINYI